MNIKTPSEITRAAIAAGRAKAARTVASPIRLLLAAVMAGAFIAIGGTLALIVGYGFPEATAGNPALARMLSGVMFPIGLILVVVLGAELFTGNNATLIPAYMQRHYSFGIVVRNWTVVYIGNFIGAVAFTYIFVYLAGLVEAELYRKAIGGIALAKTSMTWPVVFIKGIGANWLVCLGVWLAMAGHNFVEKALGCWLPVMAFVVFGFEHSIANMFYLPLGLFVDTVGLTADACLTNNLIPATLGNIVGGAVFVGCLHSVVHPDNPKDAKIVVKKD